MIAERSGTHETDVACRDLAEEEYASLQAALNAPFQS